MTNIVVPIAPRPTAKFWETKGLKVARQVAELEGKNPAMLAMLCAASWYCWTRFKKKITITSVYREGEPTVHGSWRGTDLRVFLISRDGEDGVDVELLPSEARALVSFLNTTFSYGRTSWGRKTVVAHYREPGEGRQDTAIHVHLQTRGFQWKM